MSSSRPDFDIVVVGGGMVGPCFAALAARDPHVGGLRVALVEPATPAAPRAGEVDLRVSALSRASQRILNAVEALGADRAGGVLVLGDGGVGRREPARCT